MRFSTSGAAEVLKEYFGIDGDVSNLSGYDEWNYLITTKDGKRYIFKVAREEHGVHFLDAQVQITDHLANTPLRSKLQQHVAGLNNKKLVPAIIDGKQYYLRLLNFLEGDFWAAQKADLIH